MILDSKNVITGAKEGVQICLLVIIPSLFPYLILSNILTTAINGRWSIFATGLLGGYPAGAQAIKTAYDLKRINKNQAENMLTYCNQAGPAFIFGMLSQLFTRAYIPWLIWCIHILSALIIYTIFHKGDNRMIQANQRLNTCTLPESVERSVKSISLICGWVILFRIILQIINIRIFRQGSGIGNVIISGLLELSNGCVMLNGICNERLRFILCAVFLGFGGICVTFQTISITKGLKIKKYVIAKVFQCFISGLMAAVFSVILLH